MHKSRIIPVNNREFMCALYTKQAFAVFLQYESKVVLNYGTQSICLHLQRPCEAKCQKAPEAKFRRRTSRAEWNANEQNPLFSLICIRFGSCEVRRLNRACHSAGHVSRNSEANARLMAQLTRVGEIEDKASFIEVYHKTFS